MYDETDLEPGGLPSENSPANTTAGEAFNLKSASLNK